MKQYNVFPECNVDTNLVGHILGGYAKHKSTCNEVVKAVNNSDEFAIGIIDADKRPATMDAGFVRYEQTGDNDGRNSHLTMYIHRDKKRYMFTVYPAMDGFVWDAAHYMNVDMKALGYKSTFEAFRKKTKTIQAATDPTLRRLFHQIANYPELTRFRNTLKYLMNEQYDADPTIAKQFFDGMLSNADLAMMLQYNQKNKNQV